MTTHRLVSLVRRRLLVIILGVVLGVGAAGLYSVLATPVYSSTTKLYASPTITDANGSELLNSGLYTRDQVKSYAQLVTTPTVLDDVIDELDLDVSSRELSRQVSVTVPLNTVVVEITAHDDAPDEAAELAAAIAKELPSVVEALEQRSEGKRAPMRLSVIQDATAPEFRDSPNIRVNLLAGLLLGAILGLSIAIALEALRRRVTSVGEVEELTGLPVLGLLPEPGSESTPDSQRATRLVWASMLAAVGHAPRAFLLASIAEGSSASRLASRLAPIIAETERSVVWVDADLLGGRTTTALGVGVTPGLADVLSGEATLDEIVVPWGDSTMSVVPSGSSTSDASSQYAGAALAAAIEDLRGGFETVVVDGTSTTDLSALALLAQHVEAVVLVVTPAVQRDQLAQVAREIRAASMRVVGLVIDDIAARDRADFERRLVSQGDVVDD
ncbi:Wzz/FepE/Etk N-terminal domain-containing protein [Nocardioides pacificus]